MDVDGVSGRASKWRRNSEGGLTIAEAGLSHMSLGECCGPNILGLQFKGSYELKYRRRNFNESPAQLIKARRQDKTPKTTMWDSGLRLQVCMGGKVI